jgi:MYXO-CTERM domain-containing protein
MQMKFNRGRHALAAGAIAACLAVPSTALAGTVYGVTENQTLVTWDTSSPGTIQGGIAISGLMNNEQIRGIDFRPATGELYALGSFSNLYTVDVSTGLATNVGGGQFSPGMNGSTFGFDFNPTIDRIRVVSDADQNLVLNPNDGSSTQVTSLFYGPGDSNEGIDPNVVGSAYTNSFPGATMTQLYGIDTGLDVLVRQANSAGTLETVGSLGVDLTDVVGFDIDGSNNLAYATVQDSTLSRSTFWTIDLNTGEANLVGEIGGGAFITSMAVVPTPGAVGLIGLAGIAGLRRRR